MKRAAFQRKIRLHGKGPGIFYPGSVIGKGRELPRPRCCETQLTDGHTVQSPVRYPHSFYLAELFRIDAGMIRQIEANFITVPYHMKSCWDGQ